MSTLMPQREKAEEEWTDMDVIEKIAAVDPDHCEELLVRFIEYIEGKVGGSREEFHTKAVESFLDNTYGATWIDNRSVELGEGRGDD